MKSYFEFGTWNSFLSRVGFSASKVSYLLKSEDQKIIVEESTAHIKTENPSLFNRPYTGSYSKF